jgi:hypothetical protein
VAGFSAAAAGLTGVAGFREAAGFTGAAVGFSMGLSAGEGGVASRHPPSKRQPATIMYESILMVISIPRMERLNKMI